MEINFHVKLRFVQRIIGIEDVNAAKKFIEQNEYEVVYKILEFINEAQLLHENYAPARKDTLDYYINGETLLVLQPKKKGLVTLFDVTLDADDKTNSDKIRQYIKAIKQNNNAITKINVKQKKQDIISHHLEYMLKYLGENVSEEVKTKIYEDRQKSIDICKEYAANAKEYRMENRELMSEMFKKLENKE
ncbi:hypothetical protein [Bacillus infantis]|uniref:hypothetical protein n=1 Tax=Bacillus infantis TaxID=324767 RepID=UPI003CEEDBEA